MLRIASPLIVAALLAAGCSSDGVPGMGGGGPGVTKRFITDPGEQRCAFDEQFRTAVAEADLEPVEKDPKFAHVILNVGDRDWADSADSTDLYDVRGAYQICRYAIGERYLVEGYLYYFSPTEDRDRLKDAEAWTYAYEDVDNGYRSMDAATADDLARAYAERMKTAKVDEPVSVPVEDGPVSTVVKVRASGGEGASAALALSFETYEPDPDAPDGIRGTYDLTRSDPADQDVVDEIARTIATTLSAR